MYKVVIVDDEPVIRTGLIKLLEWDELGLSIVGEAGNGFEALDVIKRENPDIIILDIRMPGMDGIQLLKNLRDVGVEAKVIILSGYDSFQYIKETMLYRIENYLLKPVNVQELQSTLLNIMEGINKEINLRSKQKENADVLRNNILNRVVNNQISEEELQERLDFLEIRLSGRFFMTAVIETISTKELSLTEVMELNPYSVQDIIKEALTEKCENICFRNTAGRYVVIFHSMQDSEEAILQALQECISRIVHDLHLDVLIYSGRKVKERSSIHLSYSDALALGDYKYFNSRNRLIHYSVEIEKFYNNKNLIPIDISRFESLLLACNHDGVSLFLDDLLTQCLKIKGIKPEYIKAIGIQLIMQLIKVARDLKLDFSDFLVQNNLVDKALECDTAEKLIDLIKSLCITLMIHIARKKNNPLSLIDEILLYINKNYAEEMSLKTLAASFGVTPSYLGQQFKIEANDIFTDYLNKLRVEKARGMLMNTQEKACDIAYKVGYKDPNYFYKIFKKYTGMFPSEYRLNK